MKIFQHILEVPSHEIKDSHFLVTIGNFDGVHKGHHYLINELKKLKQNPQDKILIITFTPHPVEVLQPQIDNFLIYSYETKQRFLEELGVDYLIEIPFNRDLSFLDAKKFLEDYKICILQYLFGHFELMLDFEQSMLC